MDIPTYNEFEEAKHLDKVNKLKRRKRIIEFFSTQQNVDDSMIHNLAEELGVDNHKFEGEIYSILTSFFYYGRFRENPLISVDPEELKKGMKVEMEHTDCLMIAERIALDHLAELTDYYTRLAKMEDDAGVEH